MDTDTEAYAKGFCRRHKEAAERLTHVWANQIADAGDRDGYRIWTAIARYAVPRREDDSG